jgi:hypothetical protein
LQSLGSRPGTSYRVCFLRFIAFDHSRNTAHLPFRRFGPGAAAAF